MKSILTITIFSFAAVLMLVFNRRAEQLTGTIGSAAGRDRQSSWIDLTNMTNFRPGERLKITVQGTAENVVSELLPQGYIQLIAGHRGRRHEGSQRRSFGSAAEKEERRNVVQISVHGSQKAWNISLGSGNGPVTLEGVDRVAPSNRTTR